MFLNSTPFGITDPEFGIDVSFYAFQLPFYRYVLDWLFVARRDQLRGRADHPLHLRRHPAHRPRRPGLGGRARPARRCWPGCSCCSRRWPTTSTGTSCCSPTAADIFTGATYTDLNAVMPAKLILLFISIICAAAFFAAVFRRNLQLPAIATVLLVLSSVLIGAAWPQVLQQFVGRAERATSARPSRSSATSRPPAQAFGLTDDKVTEVPYSGTSRRHSGRRSATDTATMPNIRLLDPAKLERDVHPAAAAAHVLRVPAQAGHRPLQRRRPDPGLHRRRARAEHAAGSPATRPTGSTGTSSTRTATGSWWRRPTRSTRRWRTAAARAGCRCSPASTPPTRSRHDPGEPAGPGAAHLLRRADRHDYSIVGAQEGGRAARVRLRHRSSYTYPASGGVPLGNIVNRWSSRS